MFEQDVNWAKAGCLCRVYVFHLFKLKRFTSNHPTSSNPERGPQRNVDRQERILDVEPVQLKICKRVRDHHQQDEIGNGRKRRIDPDNNMIDPATEIPCRRT